MQQHSGHRLRYCELLLCELTGTFKCSVIPRPVPPRAPNEIDSSRKRRTLCFKQTLLTLSNGQIIPLFK